MTLVILAAGMGSRYGGLKQIDPITDSGEFIIDFSVFDAIRAGFDKIVFVIKEENLNEFKDTIGKRFENKIRVEYAFQKLDDIPKGFSIPEGRVKPWGTAHALLAARNIVDDNFAVINADDFYGKSAYSLIANHFEASEHGGVSDYCMVGYKLENTLTENGTVSRGICNVGDDGYLCDIVERTSIRRAGNVAAYEENGVETVIPLESIASMNCWGFTPDIFDGVMEGFKKFLANVNSASNPQKAEYYLPFAVRELMDDGKCSVKVYPSDSIWYGVTYHEDKEKVMAGIQALKDSGEYPDNLNQ
ncbi:MAG: nucleotidyltransferase [Clostridia bacterium]|nr:nucleotidyltransferase [Clostridia bacterium]